jgi:hypothetical protein
MHKFSYSGALVVCLPHTRIFCHEWRKISNMFDIWFTCHEWRKFRKRCPHTRIFCRSNLSRITSTRDKCTRVRRALGPTIQTILWPLNVEQSISKTHFSLELLQCGTQTRIKMPLYVTIQLKWKTSFIPRRTLSITKPVRPWLSIR